MKYLIVGLGNIGAEYAHTRHNIGFDIVDQIATDHNAQWKTATLGDVATCKHRGRQIILLKPSTYMNRSGKAVNYWMQKEKVKLDNVLIIVDDLHIDFGALRLRGKGSDGGHNGLKDINQTIGSRYARLRVGIGKDYHPGQQVNYVLGKWTDSQQKEIPQIIENSAACAMSFVSIGMAHTMNKYNK